MPLLPGPGLSAVTLADPVTLQLDVNAAARARRPAAARGPARTASGTPPPTSTCWGRAGTPWRCGWPTGDRWSVTLAALTAPPGPEVRRLLKRGDSVVVPAADRDDLVAEYLRGCSGTSR